MASDNDDQQINLTCGGQQSLKPPDTIQANKHQLSVLTNPTSADNRKYRCYNWRLDPVTLVRMRSFKNAKQLYAKISKKKVNAILRSQEIPKLIHDIALFIYFLASFIHSIVQFAVKQDSLSYNIVCLIVSFIGLVKNSYDIAKKLYKHYITSKHKTAQVEPHSDEDTRNTAWAQMEIRDIEDVENQLSEGVPSQEAAESITDEGEKLEEEKLEKSIIKDIVLKYIFIMYPAVICGLYGLIKEKSWQFHDAFAGINFLIFLWTFCMDALDTNFEDFRKMQRIISSLHYYSSDDCKTKFNECCVPSLLLIPYILLLALIHWLILAIIGIRIHVDNFSSEINNADMSKTDNYKITFYTGYVIFCGVYLPVASAIVFIVINRAWFSNEINTTQKLFYFLGDPISYYGVILLMPFL